MTSPLHTEPGSTARRVLAPLDTKRSIQTLGRPSLIASIDAVHRLARLKTGKRLGRCRWRTPQPAPVQARRRHPHPARLRGH